ncbi:hypothetical protein SLA2020_519100 [Shorea laevis]
MVVASSNPHNKEIQIRKRIASIFNKREEDFPCLRDYNDYLEEVEDMIFKLIDGIDVQAIEEKIKNYQEENAVQIMMNQAKKAQDLDNALKASKGHPIQMDADGVSAHLQPPSKKDLLFKSICTLSCGRGAEAASNDKREWPPNTFTLWWGHRMSRFMPRLRTRKMMRLRRRAVAGRW